ncbi:MAG: hypothetical protein K9H64_07075 [Bacteroidales bacterium]|nr:hypothetical protein [Bacteroidales bacterium]MCF8455578.1 hypothetical protein [Bacteroidales bacterium]
MSKRYIKNPLGLSIHFLENGLLKSIDVDPIRIGLKAATPFSKSGVNLYLRKRSQSLKYKALLGPESNSRFTITEDAFIAKGSWDGLDYVCTLQLSKKSLSWQWRVEITNTSDNAVELDMIYLQDAGLKQISDAPTNEYYVSQYLDRLILDDPHYGSVICCRQNNKEATGNPWLMMACKNSATAASTDGIQFYGKTFKETGIPEGLLAEKLAGECSGELSILALQEKPFTISAKGHHKSVFVATYFHDHPLATSAKDLERLSALMLEFENKDSGNDPDEWLSPEKNSFTSAVLLAVDDLNNKELDQFFGKDRRYIEEENGQLLSFFYKENNHVVLRAKEVLVDRPHGHIMQAKADYTPDENIVSTTSYAFGVFNSQLTQGNTNFNALLSISASQFNLERETGQRIFVQIDGQHYLLGIPSAFEIGLNHCRWIYKQGNYCFQVRSWTSKTAPQVNMDFKVLSGPVVKLLITNHFDEANGWTFSSGNTRGEYIVKPNTGSLIAGKFPNAQFGMLVNSINSDYHVYGDEVLYPNKRSHGGSFLNLEVAETSNFCMSFIGEISSPTHTPKIEDADKQWLADCQDAQTAWQDLSLNLSLKGKQKDIAAMQEILPWYATNALTHLLTPHGLEQFSGAAWGTRDTMQGPFELLLSLQKYDEARQILRIMFSNQNMDGGWPQWFMFDSYFTIRSDSAHGDIFYWCIIALSSYIKATGDYTFLEEILPYYHEKGVEVAEKTPLSEHIDRLIKMIVDSFIPGTALVPFGGGDWNDSMQPVNKDLAQRLISCWTVELNYQAFNEYQTVYEKLGQSEKAANLKEICRQIKADFNTYLIKDGVVGGHGLIEADGTISLLLHPSDTKTNIQYRLLPMIRGIISGIFTPEQVRHHQAIIEQHLKGPDGARLMNRPPKYNGGIQTIFQRAESSSFFGREIGIMYTHAHLRYAESLARTGKADAFVKALRQANPVSYREIVSCGDFRQSNCYYSSSDVTFRNRYEADERYEELIAGKITLKGGWRIYSSGPGIYMGLIVSRLLGLRTEFGNTILDPVIPVSMDGLEASIDFMGHPVTFKYTVKKNCFGPKAISINGKEVEFTLEDNQYRAGGAVIPTDQFVAMLNQKENRIELQL